MQGNTSVPYSRVILGTSVITKWVNSCWRWRNRSKITHDNHIWLKLGRTVICLHRPWVPAWRGAGEQKIHLSGIGNGRGSEKVQFPPGLIRARFYHTCPIWWQYESWVKCCQEDDFRHFQQEVQLKMWSNKESPLSTPFLEKSGQRRGSEHLSRHEEEWEPVERYLPEISVSPDRIKLGNSNDWLAHSR